MDENVILLGHEFERPRSSVKVNDILHCNPHPTHEYTCEVSLRSY